MAALENYSAKKNTDGKILGINRVDGLFKIAKEQMNNLKQQVEP
jgi:hypothetical protein